VQIGVIGLGYWGPNLVRNFLAHPEVQSVFGYDIKTERAKAVQSRSPGLILAEKLDELFDKCDALILATPVAEHYSQTKKALESGKHVLVEKPFTTSSQQANELVNLAKLNNLRLMVDHTFVFTPAVQYIKNMVETGEIGQFLYYDSVRINLGLFRRDCSVLWDLAYHDLSILQEILPNLKPVKIVAQGKDHYNQGMVSLAYLTLYYPQDILATTHVSWLAPVKHRKIIIGGSKKMIVYDDNEVDEKIKIYDKGVEIINGQDAIHDSLVQYRMGDIHIPQIKQKEALAVMVDNFINAIKTQQEPLTSGAKSAQIVKILETAEESIRGNGIPLDIKL
jgi:predicted dehydrogenase